MSGLKTGLAAVVLLGACGASSRAQNIVPGGWAAEFGYQSFGTMGAAGGVFYDPSGFATAGPSFGYTPYGGGVGPFSYGGGISNPSYAAGVGPTFRPPGFPGVAAPTPQTFQGTGSLIGVIRQSTRRPARR